MAITSKFSFADLQNPLFLHPSDGPLSISVTKLQGAADYRTWHRSMEIQLSSKRKLGFVEGTELRSTTDAAEAAQWNTCNNMVLSWLHNNVCDSIKQYVLFINTSEEIWKQLEKRFQLSNGSRKYKLSKDLYSLKQKDLYSLKQNGKSLVDYYTTLSALWEELEAMNNLPVLTTTSDEIKTLLKVIQVKRDESKLFQFLNGLDDMFGPQRSQLLMMSPLPSVELACAVIQHEESQHDVLHSHPTDDISAMYNKGIQQGVVEKSGDKYVVCTKCIHRPQQNAHVERKHRQILDVTKALTLQSELLNEHWAAAMNLELAALEDNDPWEITTLPPYKISIGCKWLFKTKFKADGSLECFKARLMTGCFKARFKVVAINDWFVVQMDISNTFLHGEFHVPVYMKMPLGYNNVGCRISPCQGEFMSSSNSSHWVCKLKNSLYGLKQAPRLWFSKLFTTLLDLDFVQSKNDYGLITLTSGNTITLVLVYVDDLLLAGNSDVEIQNLKGMLSTTFHMTLCKATLPSVIQAWSSVCHLLQA